jgi:hypothetical protein
MPIHYNEVRLLKKMLPVDISFDFPNEEDVHSPPETLRTEFEVCLIISDAYWAQLRNAADFASRVINFIAQSYPAVLSETESFGVTIDLRHELLPPQVIELVNKLLHDMIDHSPYQLRIDCVFC